MYIDDNVIVANVIQAEEDAAKVIAQIKLALQGTIGT